MINGTNLNIDPNKIAANEMKNMQYIDTAQKRAIEDKNESGEPTKKAKGISECQTCKNRRYVDGSNDPGVSFKTPTKVSPEEAASKVLSHETEHYTRENNNAKKEGKKVISNSIQLYTGICPECGKVYISGGVTRTTTASKREEDQAEMFKKFFDETLGNNLPHQIDTTV